MMTSSERQKHNAQIGLIVFRLGQGMFLLGYVFFVVGISSTHWVDRPAVNMTDKGITAKVTKHYGLFAACLQLTDSGTVGNCDQLWKNLNYVSESASRFIQALMVISCIFFFAGLILEVLQILPLSAPIRNFMAKNRVVELFSSVAAVVALCGIVVYAGEVKNKAERVDGQDEEAVGWSFIMTVVGLGLCTLGIMTVIMFRELPVRKDGDKGGSWMRF